MLLSPEIREKLVSVVRQSLPKQYQDDLAFVADLAIGTLETRTDPDQARMQLTTELTTYFEATTSQVVAALLTEVTPRKDSATVFLRRVPKNLNTIEQLSGYFQQFGSLVNVQVFPLQNSAQVCFADDSSAVAALTSQQPVLDCRFIRLSAFRPKKAKPEVERRVQTKKAARELEQRRFQLSAEKTKTVQTLLKLLNERRGELSQEQEKALLEQIRVLGAEVPPTE